MKSLFKIMAVATLALIVVVMANHTFWLGFSDVTLMWLIYGSTFIIWLFSRSKMEKKYTIIDPASKEIHSFKSKNFSIVVDLATRTVKVTIPNVHTIAGIIDGVNLTPQKNAKFEVVSPIDSFSIYSVYPITKTKYIQSSYSGMVDGKFVSMSGGEVKAYEAPTGKSNIQFTSKWDSASKNSLGNSKKHDAQENHYVVGVANVIDQDVANLKAWWSGFQNCVKLVRDEKQKILTKRNTEEKEARERQKAADEAAEANAKAARLEAANERFRAMIDKAEIAGHFKAWRLDASSKILWSIAVDRNGSGFVTAADCEWIGQFANASASFIPAGAGTQNHLEVLVEDKAYEDEHLTKRRLRLMHGETREVIQEWSDRINLLRQKAA